MSSVDRLRAAIRDVPDFPKPGIVFKDITPILGNAALFDEAVRLFVDRHAGSRIDLVAAVEARGFLFGGAVARALGAGLVPVRKKGKLPWRTREASYDLEYGSATLAIHEDAVPKGARILLIDDLLATGGTAAAAASLIEACGGEVIEADFLVELGVLHGRSRMGDRKVFAPLLYT